MKKIKIVLGVALLLAGWIATARAEVWSGKAHIEFQATSTLHDFSGTVQTEPFQFIVDPDGTWVTLAATASVAVAHMNTQHAKRDENMRKMFDAARFPSIRGEIDSIRVNPTLQPEIPLRLTMLNRTQVIPATLRNWRLENGLLHVDLAMTISLQKSGLSPPVILGFIKVGDTVDVLIHIELKAEPFSSPL